MQGAGRQERKDAALPARTFLAGGSVPSVICHGEVRNGVGSAVFRLTQQEYSVCASETLSSHSPITTSALAVCPCTNDSSFSFKWTRVF